MRTDSVMGDWDYTYDALDRLTTVTVDANVPAQYQSMIGCWTYDACGNRLIEAGRTALGQSPVPRLNLAV